ncbi:GNAT family N-acetyltransferase [Nonomuraea mesophila]|uniref:GNAT family N-acetyltransferase n=1 Tax=Nonomuraea mesophila TaxID=2530382 RepID=A0A4R5EPZ3_9ACTN|nr:GNAT family N-acetyltransferase [Nonomuraea mesophila]TDE36849.1 GNAT family N-acetyltransferase [Nonomuraea mesophila]
MTDHVLRAATPGDYDAIAAVVDEWWGRPILASLPRLFLDHFHHTSLIAESPAGPAGLGGPDGPDGMAGFLIGFVSPSQPGEAYIHFVGVAPAARRSGVARSMYERFFGIARDHGRHVVRAITAPVNERSVAFHRRMGFEAGGPVPGHNGPGTSLVTFVRTL